MAGKKYFHKNIVLCWVKITIYGSDSRIHSLREIYFPPMFLKFAVKVDKYLNKTSSKYEYAVTCRNATGHARMTCPFGEK